MDGSEKNKFSSRQLAGRLLLHSGKSTWRGVASETLSGKAEKGEKKLAKVVADMLKHFPPTERG